MKHSSSPPDQQGNHRLIRLRRRAISEWLALLIWLVLLVILLEYALTSLYEHETQAAILAGALGIGLLVAGIIIQFMRGIEARSQYQDDPHPPPSTEGIAEDDHR